MQQIRLIPLIHRNNECIGIYFDKNVSIEYVVRKQPGAKWSRTNKCWYIPLTEEYYTLLVADLHDKAKVDNGALKGYLQKKRKLTTVMPEPKQNPVTKKITYIKPVALSPAWQLSTVNLKALESFVQLLKLKAYSASTINTYRNEFIQLLKLLKKKPLLPM